MVKINYLADWREGISPELWTNGSPLCTATEPSLSFPTEVGLFGLMGRTCVLQAARHIRGTGLE